MVEVRGFESLARPIPEPAFTSLAALLVVALKALHNVLFSFQAPVGYGWIPVPRITTMSAKGRIPKQPRMNPVCSELTDETNFD